LPVVICNARDLLTWCRWRDRVDTKNGEL